MYEIVNTTDGKYTGLKVDISVNPVIISEDLTFQYDKKIIAGQDAVIANSNYIIYLRAI